MTAPPFIPPRDSVPRLNPETLLVLTQAILEDVPVGLLLLDSAGEPLWYNTEAALACSVWNHGERNGAALRLESVHFRVPEAFREACQLLVASWNDAAKDSSSVSLSEPERGLHARLSLRRVGKGRSLAPAFFVQLDYRRPRGDRDRALSPGAIVLLARLAPQEREVAMRLREGLSTAEIAAQLHRSPLTVKTQLAAIFTKFGVRGRSRVTMLLNR